MLPGEDRRQRSRQAADEAPSVQIGLKQGGGAVQAVGGTIVDFSDSGVGLSIRTSLQAGNLVTLWGPFFKKNGGPEQSARVVHCRIYSGGGFRAGCVYTKADPDKTADQSAARPSDDSFVDYYEALQISPNASFETIQRVYRMLAHLYHPDNKETGHSEAFQLLLKAYHVLGDPEKRAKYDISYHAERTKRWKIFDDSKAAQGVEAEKRKRWGVLSILYRQRIEDPEHPGMRANEFEQLLGCPREHLLFTCWYLREQGLIRHEQNARYEITAHGVDTAEKAGLWKPQELPPLLEEGDLEEVSDEGN